MDLEAAAMLRELKDRQEIYDCLMRYCRGVDRLDRSMILSAYHPDALDDHGQVVAPVEKFIDTIFAQHTERQVRTQHHITNHICELDGDTAHTESYFMYRAINKTPPVHTFGTGRYIDRFEKRSGVWAISARVCITEIMDDTHSPTGSEHFGKYLPASRDKDDYSYRRPLTIDPARFTD